MLTEESTAVLYELLLLQSSVEMLLTSDAIFKA
jgi:hypothetical protein